VLDLVLLARAGREVTDADLKAGLVGQALQLGLPQARAVAIRAAAVGRDRQRGRVGEALGSKVLPPALDRGDGELGGVVVDRDLNPAPVVGEVIDPVGDRLAQQSASSVGSVSVSGLRPPPGRRTRPRSSVPPDSNSQIPVRIVSTAIPVARATAAIPPRPAERASAAAHNRRWRSLSSPAIARNRSPIATSSITPHSST